MKAIDLQKFNPDCPEEVMFFDLPDDLMSVWNWDGKTFCHSESTGKYYAITEEYTRIGCHVYPYLLQCGSWLDCMRTVSPSGCDDNLVPFMWGKPLPSAIVKGWEYIPFFESVDTGKRTEDDCPVSRTEYRLLCCEFPSWVEDNDRLKNAYTSFEVETFDSLYDMVNRLQHYIKREF